MQHHTRIAALTHGRICPPRGVLPANGSGASELRE